MVPTPRGTARRRRSSSARLAGPGTSPSSLRACGRVTSFSFTETVGGPPPLDAPASLVAPSSPAAPSSLLSPAGARRRPTSLNPKPQARRAAVGRLANGSPAQPARAGGHLAGGSPRHHRAGDQRNLHETAGQLGEVRLGRDHALRGEHAPLLDHAAGQER